MLKILALTKLNCKKLSQLNCNGTFPKYCWATLVPIICCLPWLNLGGLKFKRARFIWGAFASSLCSIVGKSPETDRRAGPRVGLVLSSLFWPREPAEKVLFGKFCRRFETTFGMMQVVFFGSFSFSFRICSLDEIFSKIVWPDSTFLLERIDKTAADTGSLAWKLGRHFCSAFSGLALVKNAEKLFEASFRSTFSFAEFATKVFEEKFGLGLASESSHLKKAQPELFRPGSLLRAEQAKKLRPWFGPGFETIKRLLRRPQEQSGGVLRILKFLF